MKLIENIWSHWILIELIVDEGAEAALTASPRSQGESTLTTLDILIDLWLIDYWFLDKSLYTVGKRENLNK